MERSDVVMKGEGVSGVSSSPASRWQPQAFEIVDDSEREPVNRIRQKYGPLFDALNEGKTVRLPFEATNSFAIRSTYAIESKGNGKHVHLKRDGESFIAWADEKAGCTR